MKRFKSFKVGAVVTVLSFLSAFAALDNPLKSYTCRSLGRLSQPAATALCKFDDRPVTLNEARSFLDEFFGKASGAVPAEALGLVSPGAGVNPDAFIKQWQPSLWAEVVKGPRPGRDFNTYYFDTRDYRLSAPHATVWTGEVEIRHRAYRLERTDDGVRLHGVRLDGNGEVWQAAFPRVSSLGQPTHTVGRARTPGSNWWRDGNYAPVGC